MKKKIKKMISTISPEFMTRLMYYHNFRKRLNLNNPSNINEKIQYLKLKTYYNNPVVTQCVDKYRVRSYLREKGCEGLLTKLYHGGITDPEEVRRCWDSLPNRFVVKCNHGSGYNILVSDKAAISVDEVVEKLHRWMKEDYWTLYGETQYRFIPKAILIEQYLADHILTYKFYCFHGEPKVVYILDDSGVPDYQDGTKFEKVCTIDDSEITILSSEEQYVQDLASAQIELAKMLEIARHLSAEFPLVRIDLYDVNGQIYFSEFTFIPTGGLMRLSPEAMDAWGKWLNMEGL